LDKAFRGAQKYVILVFMQNLNFLA
jgi:hypothetical protein